MNFSTTLIYYFTEMHLYFNFTNKCSILSKKWYNDTFSFICFKSHFVKIKIVRKSYCEISIVNRTASLVERIIYIPACKFVLYLCIFLNWFILDHFFTRGSVTMDYELMSKWQNATFLQIYWRNKLIYILGVHFQHIFIGVNYSFKCETSLEPLPCSPLTTVYIYICIYIYIYTYIYSIYY